MKEKLLVLCAGFVAVYGSGCATIVTGKYQDVTVTSDPPGAKVKAETGEAIITPGVFHLRRSKDHVLVARYGDFEPQQRHIKHKLQGWFWGNILLGGIIGGVIDAASGSSGKLRPNVVNFDFTAVGVQTDSRKSAYLKAHPDLTDQVQFAIENELATKGMTKEDLEAALGPPDDITETGKYEEYFYEDREPQRYYLKDGKLVKAK